MVSVDPERGEYRLMVDWKRAVKTPPSYRVGKNGARPQSHAVSILAIGALFFFIIIYSSYSSSEDSKVVYGVRDLDKEQSVRSMCSPDSKIYHYNDTYPISKPTHIHDSIHYQIGVVADMDHSSKSQIESNTWVSYFMKGTLVWTPKDQSVSITWDKNNFKTLKTNYGHKGRGMELSELVTFDGRLITFDDRSGIVYFIEDDKAYPWIMLIDGNGKTSKGFKAEWAAVKDQHLYIGSMGKEWTSPQGEFVSNDPFFVKKISPTGEVVSVDWKDNYIKLRGRVGIHFPGYMLHESGTWSDVHKKWFFLPRRMSKEPYNEEKDEFMGTNILLQSDANFEDIEVTRIGEILPTHGYSSFKFLPGTNDEIIVALKTTEVSGKTSTFISVFTIHGRILLGEKKVDDIKYEGFEFI